MKIRDKILLSFIILAVIPLVIFYFFIQRTVMETLNDFYGQQFKHKEKIHFLEIKNILNNKEYTLDEINETIREKSSFHSYVFDLKDARHLKGKNVFSAGSAHFIFTENEYKNFIQNGEFSADKEFYSGKNSLNGKLSAKLINGSLVYICAFDLAEPRRFSKKINFLFLNFSAVLILIILIFALFFSKIITSPIIRVTNAAEIISRGNFDINLKTKRKDEIGGLVNIINSMALNLKTLFNTTKTLKQFNENIIESMTGGVLTVNLNGDIVVVNSRACEILNFSKTEILNKNIKRIYDLNNFFKEINATLKNGEIEKRKEINLKDKTLGTSSNILTDENNKKIGYAFLFQDITKIRELEREIQQKKRIEVLGHMAAGIAHEIRNPLNPIKGFAGLIKLETENPEINSHCDAIINSVSAIESTVNSMLLYTKNIDIRSEKIYLPEIINEIKEELPVLKQKQLNLTLNLKVNEIYHDKNIIKIIVSNLIRNAADAVMEESGKITVETEKINDKITIKVKDNGLGISKEIIKRIFDPFFTTKGNIGTGLGLSIVKKLTDMINGRIKIKTKILSGTEFKILFEEIK